MWNGDIAVGIVMAACVLGMIAGIPHFIGIIPSLLDCFVRWKGTVSLHYSVSLSRSRDLVTLTMAAPFILVAARFDLMNLQMLFSPIAGIGIYAGIFVCFLLVRALTRIFRSDKISRKDWKCVQASDRNFFILLVIIELITYLVAYSFRIEETIVKQVILWEIYVVYFIFLVRKGEILYHIRNNFLDILYLCTLEFLPVGIIVVSEILL